MRWTPRVTGWPLLLWKRLGPEGCCRRMAALSSGTMGLGGPVWLELGFYESWGWAPYHYGRWAVVDGIWVWLPGSGPQVYSPGLVTFVGGGDEFGWFPLGPEEPYVAVYGVGFCCRPYREYYNYPYVTVINRTEIVNAHYSYTRVDNHFYERATTARGLEIRPTRDTLYARRDAHGVLDARGHVAAQPIRAAHFTPPNKIANSNRPVRAIHDAPAVKSFNTKLAEMPKSGPPRGVNPVDGSRKAVAATMPRPAGLKSAQPKSFKVPSTTGNAGTANRLQPPASGPKTFQVPASPASSHAAVSKPNELPTRMRARRRRPLIVTRLQARQRRRAQCCTECCATVPGE